MELTYSPAVAARPARVADPVPVVDAAPPDTRTAVVPYVDYGRVQTTAADELSMALEQRTASGLNLSALLSNVSSRNGDLKRLFDRAYALHPIVFAAVNQQATMAAEAAFEIGTPGANT